MAACLAAMGTEKSWQMTDPEVCRGSYCGATSLLRRDDNR